MFEQYHMVVISSILSLSVLFAMFLYKLYRPDKNIQYFLLLIIISLLPVISIFREGSYESGDFNIHIYRAMDFYNALSDGQMIPSWPENLNATYGYPLFFFNYSLPYYLIAVFHSIGFSFITSMKLYLSVSYILSGVTMYLLGKELFKNLFASFFASIFYLFTPYHLVDLHFRATAGELITFAILPLLFLSLIHLFRTLSLSSIIYTAITIGILNIAHMGTFFLSLLIIGPFTLFSLFSHKHKRKTSFYLFMSGLIGLLLSMFIWMPYLSLAKYTHGDMLANKIVSFTPLYDLLYSPYRFGFLFQGPHGELSFLIGYTQIITILVAIVLILKKSKGNKYSSQIRLWTTFTLFIIFLLLPISAFVWKILPFINTVQFSYRLLLILTFVIAILSGYIALTMRKKKFILSVLVIATIGYTILNWGTRTVVPSMTDETLRNNLPKSTAEGEGFCCYGTPIWVDEKSPWMKTIPKSHLEIVKGNGEYRELFRNSLNHEYVVAASTNLTLQENTLYFPGWQILVNGTPAQLQYDFRKQGLIMFTIPKGLSYVEILYKDIPIIRFAKTLSLTLFGILGLYILYDLMIRVKTKITNHFGNKSYLTFFNSRKQRKRKNRIS